MHNIQQSTKHTQQIVIRIPTREKMFLENTAQKQNTTISELTRQALRKFIYPTQKNNNHLVTLGEIGKSKLTTKKPKKLSTTYKRYLYQK